MIQRTQVFKLLCGYRDVPAADLDALAMALVRLSHLAAELAAVVEIDINPLLADADGIVALDARMRVQAASVDGATRFAIRPYPTELEFVMDSRLDEGLLIRPVVPEDQPNLLEAFPQMPEFTSMRLSQIDYDRQIVLVLTRPGIPGRQPIYGAARLQEDPDRTQARLYLAITVDFTGRGLGSELLRHVLRYAASRGLRRIEAVVDTAGSPLASLYEAHGFVRAGHSAKPLMVIDPRR
jgi:acetyltransferase